MDSNFSKKERLYRAVLPIDMFWKSDGSVSSAAFCDKNGLSVDRGDFREDDQVVEGMKARGLQGGVVSLTVGDCIDVEALVLYKPVDDNPYHSEIHRNQTEAGLTKSQAKRLSRKAIIICK